MSKERTAFIDSHCHLDFAVFDRDRSAIIQACRDESIEQIVIPGVVTDAWPTILTLCAQYPGVLYPALGLHPCFINEHEQSDLQRLEQYCAEQDKARKIIAIGEIGLDFFHNNDDRAVQHYYFSEQLKIACDYQLPVLIHARKSHQDVLNYLRDNPSLKGIIHAYSGSFEQAKEYLKRGFKLGFGGAFTYSKASKLRSLVSRLPMDAWVLETDAPDMSPAAHFGERNSPQYLVAIAREFAMLYDNQMDSQFIYQQLQKNTQYVFSAL